MTAEGRAIPPQDFKLQGDEWSRLKRTRKTSRKAVDGGGEFEGYSIAGDNLKITIKRGFFQYQTLELYCRDTAEARRFFDGLDPGDELLFVLGVQVRKGSSAKGVLKSVSRIGTPEEALGLGPPRL